jgi:hypothetical protein
MPVMTSGVTMFAGQAMHLASLQVKAKPHIKLSKEFSSKDCI